MTVAADVTPTGLTITSRSGGTTATVQPNVTPAKWGGSLTSTDCVHDFVVYPTGQAGAAGTANIIAYNNLYVGAGACQPALPTVYWAFNTGTGYSVTTSPIISQDGHEVAFVQSNGTGAQLVVLKWATGGSLASPTGITATANISTCTAPCMTETNFAGGESDDDTYSSPFYDYASDDAVFVGDDARQSGQVHGGFRGSCRYGPTSAALTRRRSRWLPTALMGRRAVYSLEIPRMAISPGVGLGHERHSMYDNLWNHKYQVRNSWQRSLGRRNP